MSFLSPLIPTRDDPWDREKAAHLARRAGFGATPAELDELVELGLAGAVARYLDAPDLDETFEQVVDAARSGFLPGSGGEVGALRREWLFRMVHGPQPLREKLLLLWHDHFATQEAKVIRAPLLGGQLGMLRRNAFAPFRRIVGGIARDPAMLVMLDNRLSHKDNPNENWARELLELYTVGVDRYSQHDIVELSRVFTGWTTPAPHEPHFLFDASMHDGGDKVLFGQPLAGRDGDDGVKEGEEALDRIVARDDCPRFLARKLLSWFVGHEFLGGAADSGPVDELAAVLRGNGLSLRETLRALFLSRGFHDPARHFALVKNPVELAAGTLHLLEVQNAHLAGLEDLARAMGMALFQPPSVAGWEHGPAWIDSGSIVQRFNFALRVSELPHSGRSVVGRPALDLDRLAGGGEAGPEEIVPALAARLLQRPLDAARTAAVVAHLHEVADGEADARRARRAATRAALHLLLTTPEHALA